MANGMKCRLYGNKNTATTRPLIEITFEFLC